MSGAELHLSAIADVKSILQDISDTELRALYSASEEVAHWQEILAKTSDTPVTDLLRDVETLSTESVYPKDTVEDFETGCQYYFHAHDDRDDEYGHFHNYVMQTGIPENISAARPAVTGAHQDPKRTHCHLVAIGVDNHGAPESLFTTNFWSSQDAEYSKKDLMSILAVFDISHAVPSYPVNRWVSGMLRLFRPQIEILFEQRQSLFDSLRTHEQVPDPAANEDIEVPSHIKISVPEQIADVQAEYLRRGLH